MENIVSRFGGKLVKMIKNAGSKYDDYSMSPKIRQFFLHWGYELTEKDFKLINKNKSLRDYCKWEMRNKKWEMRNDK